MTEEQKTLLERHGWEVECESPREIRHTETGSCWEVECESPREIRHTETGSFASLWAVDAVIESLEAEEKEDGDAGTVQDG